jgi:hypothetical protein
MLISELELALSALRQEHGDLNVFNEGDHHWFMPMTSDQLLVDSPLAIARKCLSDEPDTHEAKVLAILA